MTNDSHIPCYDVTWFDYCPKTPVFGKKMLSYSASNLSSKDTFYDADGYRPDKILIVGNTAAVVFGYYGVTYLGACDLWFEYRAVHKGVEYIAQIKVDGNLRGLIHSTNKSGWKLTWT